MRRLGQDVTDLGRFFFFNQRKLFEHKSLYFIPCIIYFHTPGDGWLCISVGTVICGPSHCGVSCTTIVNHCWWRCGLSSV